MPLLGAPRHRRDLLADSLIHLVALSALLIAFLVLAARPEFRVRADATRTRAYTLSAQTQQLLVGLEGRWKIAVLLGDDAAEPAVRSQIREVLRRYEDAGVEVRIIDPADPGSAAEYELLLARLRAQEGPIIAAAEEAIVRGLDRFKELILFAQEMAPQLQQLLTLAETEGADDHVRGLDVLAAQGEQIVEAVDRAMGVRELRPVPDYETARSILAAALAQYALELDGLAEALPTWLEPLAAHGVAQREAARFEKVAERLAEAADPLTHLTVPELGAMAGALERGNFAIVLGPDRAALVSPEQLFPQIQIDGGEEGIAFDRRFRGEQVLSAAIRSLLLESMPTVVFVHAEERSMFRIASEQRIDLVGARTLLEASRFPVREWMVGSGERPVRAPGAREVYIIMPPPERRGLEPSRRELMLIEETRLLIESGEAVLLNVWPSQLPRYRRVDPWAALSEPFGLRPETDQVVSELVDIGEGRYVYQQGQAIDRGADPHLMTRAIEGQQAFLVFPVPIAFRADAPVIAQARLLDVAPSSRRWLERNWTQRMGAAESDRIPEPVFTEPVSIAASAERYLPDFGVQRFILCGSGGWMHSYVLDAVTTFGGGRAALTNPGNQEFLLAAVQWLAQMDDLIAPSPVTRQASRLDGLTRGAAARWALLCVVAVPGLLLLSALSVFLVRRR